MSRWRFVIPVASLLAVMAFGACDDSDSSTEKSTASDDGGASPDGHADPNDAGLPSPDADATTSTPTPEWPFDRLPLSTLQSSSKKVYAHWHWFPVSLDDKKGSTDYYATEFMTRNGESNHHAAYGGYLRERPIARLPRGGADWEVEDAAFDVALAQHIGIDGFFVNVWNGDDQLRRRWTALFDGAAKKSGFVIAPNFDLSIMSNLSDSAAEDFMVSYLSSVATKPALFKLPDGRVVVGAFYASQRSAAFYSSLRTRLANEAKMSIYLVPVFLGNGSAQEHSTYAPVSDRLAGWGTAVPMPQGSAADALAAATKVGKPWMHPLLAQDFRPYTQAYWEASNSRTVRDGWMSAIGSGVDWVQIVTWNDHGEHHALRPSTGKQWGYYDLVAYYISWFKTGAPPSIVRDALYYYHRVHRVSATPTAQSALASCRANCPGTDEIELVSFLTAPATIEIEVGGASTSLDAPAGVSSLRAPLADGRPVFRLKRGGTTTIELTSAFDVRSAVEVQDLLYRSGGSLRAALPQDCAALCEGNDAAGCLSCNAEPVWLVANPR